MNDTENLDTIVSETEMKDMQKYEKEHNKERRRQLKVACLNLAHNHQEPSADVIERAKAYYNFVRT